MYQHDASKIAICWNFLQGNCTKSEDDCNLSHDPTPERTPLCLHFVNKGRCTRENCPFPHVNLGTRNGICRDFAVLGYCERGLDCEKQHVRECPDFAEKGSCSTKGCKLPHVIRANRNRKAVSKITVLKTQPPNPPSSVADPIFVDSGPYLPAEDAQIGDEYISLTFNESESSEDESDDDSSASQEEDAEEGTEDNDNEADEADVVVHA